MDQRSLVLTILIAKETGADLSAWEKQFCDTLTEKMEKTYLWLSPAQVRSLIKLAEKLELIEYEQFD